MNDDISNEDEHHNVIAEADKVLEEGESLHQEPNDMPAKSAEVAA